MRINRTQSILLAGGTLACFFLVSIILIQRRDAGIPTRSASVAATPAVTPEPGTSLQQSDPQAAATGTQESTFVLHKFHRSETKNGKTLWEITGSNAQYFPDIDSATIEKAKLIFYKKENNTTRLNAEKAKLFLSGPTLLKAELSEGVTMTLNNDKATITTNQATYDKEAGTVFAPGLVTIESARLHTTGNVLRARIDVQEFTLSENINSVIKPQK